MTFISICSLCLLSILWDSSTFSISDQIWTPLAVSSMEPSIKVLISHPPVMGLLFHSFLVGIFLFISFPNSCLSTMQSVCLGSTLDLSASHIFSFPLRYWHVLTPCFPQSEGSVGLLCLLWFGLVIANLGALQAQLALDCFHYSYRWQSLYSLNSFPICLPIHSFSPYQGFTCDDRPNDCRVHPVYNFWKRPHFLQNIFLHV